MPAPTVVSQVLQDDGRYLVTLSDGAEFFTPYAVAGASTLPANAAQETGGNLDAIHTATSAASTTLGTTADAAWSGSGNGGVVAVLKAIWTRLRGGQATMANSLPVAIASDQGAVPVSAASLPLPAGAATEAGHLASIDNEIGAHLGSIDTEIGAHVGSIDTTSTALATATGTQGDAAVTTAVAGSLMGYLRALKEGWLARMPSALGGHGGLVIEGVASGTAVPVSAASLPLPAGAAIEAGHLATIDTKLPAALGANGGLKIEGVASGTTVPVTAGAPTPGTLTATITNGTSLSAAVNVANLGLLRLLMSAAWTAAGITFQVSPDNVTYYNLFDQNGNEYTLTVAAGNGVMLSPSDFAGINWIKVRSGTSGSAVNQGADRVLTLVTRPFA